LIIFDRSNTSIKKKHTHTQARGEGGAGRGAQQEGLQPPPLAAQVRFSGGGGGRKNLIPFLILTN
jgi:hypothetical protein